MEGFQCPKCGNFSVIELPKKPLPPGAARWMFPHETHHTRMKCLRCGWTYYLD